MTLEDLGYKSYLEIYRTEQSLESFDIGRVISEHKERYIVKTAENELEAEIVGNLRFSATNRADFPAVGDWVAVSEYDENKGLIYAVYPRTSCIERQAVGKFGEKQIIASNIDFAFIVQSVDRDFNLNRLERYLAICNESDVHPIIILNKTDLIDEGRLNELMTKVKERIQNVPILAVSNETHSGYENLMTYIESGKTYCLLGSSGVGKSSMVNNLAEKELMKTNTIGKTTNKGKHVTSHRELIVLKNGGILIDNPGMREIGIADVGTGLDITFDRIFQLSKNCKFKDCTHVHESGCAILEAVESSEIDKDSYDNYLKMKREQAHFELTSAEKRKKDKDFGKLLKNFKKDTKYKT